ncbi:hypothetical protein OPV22_014722 [Ensete ventricosum]|uniref:Calmodulin binding protein central domain-containing protein n=1 Tax=Ensete ventricosum TaxID=4639 RepID=A0AAV8R7Q5_ENSVE|nr:hypothetical protein OPV22_014722 [Ensete ventricosum]
MVQEKLKHWFAEVLNDLYLLLESKINEIGIPQILNLIDNFKCQQANGVIAHTSQLPRSVPTEDIRPASDLQLTFTEKLLLPIFSEDAIKDKDRVRVSPGSYRGPRIKEAITESFLVLDHRSKFNQKSDPPSLDHGVWRLVNIGRNGAFHRRPDAAGIKTVHDFLKLAVVDQQCL